MRILIISLSGAGDVLMTTPLAEKIKKSNPKWIVDYLVMQEEVSRDILKDNPYIDNVIYFNFRKEGIVNSLRFCLNLKKNRYNISITTYPQARYYYSIISRLIGAERKIGFNYESHKLKLNRLFFDETIKENFNLHVVNNNLKALDSPDIENDPEISKPLLILGRPEKNYASTFLRRRKIKEFVLIHAGSGTTKNFYLKRWPKEKFWELCRQIHKRGLKIILVGGPDEIALNREIIRNSGLTEDKQIFLLGGDIKKGAAIIEKAKAVIAGDTLIGHIAAVVGTPVISLFGPTSWKNTAPFTEKRIIICKRPESITPYRHGRKKITLKQAKYMDKIEVKDVIDAVRKLLRAK